LFGVFETHDQAVTAVESLSRFGIAKATRPLSRSEYLRRIIAER
jgi:hypothetical protein